MTRINMKKRGQVTLFIILGIILVVGIVVTSVLLLKVEPKVDTPEALGPRGFIDKCVKSAIEDAVEKVSLGGGEISPDFTIRYKGANYTYLCYQSDNFKPCFNLHPILKAQVEQEIYDYVSAYGDSNKDMIQSCFNTMREDFENRGYDVTGSAINYDLELLPGEIRVNIKKPMTISKGDTSQQFENFNTKVISPLYELVRISKEIVNAEAQICYFEYSGYMVLYPQYNIKLDVVEDSKIYRVSDRGSITEFKFAVSGCKLPAGFF